MNFLKVSTSVFKASGSKNLHEKNAVEKFKRVGFWRGYNSGTPGSGAGKGGGAGGTIKESGGGLGRFGAAQEEGFFYNEQKEKIRKMKQKLKAESEKTPQQKPTK